MEKRVGSGATGGKPEDAKTDQRFLAGARPPFKREKTRSAGLSLCPLEPQGHSGLRRGRGCRMLLRNGLSVVVATPFVPSFFQAAHERALWLALAGFPLVGFAEGRATQRSEIDASTHDNETEDTHRNRLQ
jgi:hypothetical protein